MHRLILGLPLGRSRAVPVVLALVLLAACGTTSTTATGRASTTVTPPIPAATCDPATQWRAPANNVSLDDLAMVAPDEGWAVGALTPQWPPATSGQQLAGVIYHLTNGQWQRLSQTYPGAELASISMDSPTDGWAASDGSLMLHYSGGAWRQVDVPALDAALSSSGVSAGSTFFWVGIQMFGPNAGWMFGSNYDDASHPRGDVLVLHDMNGTWTRVLTPNVPATTTLFTFSAVSADEAWLVGTDYGNNLETHFFHYAGGAWTAWPQTFSGVTERFTMLSPTDGWAFDGDATGGSDHLLHFDGTTWAQVATPDWTNQQIQLTSAVFPIAPGTTWFGASHVEGFGGSALIEQYSGGQWQQVAWPYSNVAPDGLAAGSSGELWGIGDIGHQEGCAPALVTAIGQGVFLHEQHESWTEDVLP